MTYRLRLTQPSALANEDHPNAELARYALCEFARKDGWTVALRDRCGSACSGELVNDSGSIGFSITPTEW